MTYSNSILDVIGDTPLVKINRLFAEFEGVTVLAKLELLNPGGSMKDRIALKMIEKGEKKGRYKPGDTLVVPTSGNTGIAFAMAAAVKGYKLIITMPEKMSEEKRRLLRAYGAELILTKTELAYDHPDNYIEVARRLAQRPGAHFLDQYSDAENPNAHYKGTGEEIWNQSKGKIDYFVSGMGTGGTITGSARYLKEKNPDIKIIGGDPEGSLYTGEVKPYQVEGIGYDFYPKVFEPNIVDHMYRISDAESFAETRRLAKEEGILAGGSTGTVIASARKFLREQKDLTNKNMVIMIHDSGRNYLSKIYNDEWMKENGFLI